MSKKNRHLLAILACQPTKAAISAGYSLADARRAGYSLADAISAGYSLADAISAGYSLADARRAGYSLADAISAGYSLADARRAGYSLADARRAGYSLADARRAGYSLADAISAGYSLADAISAGYSLADARRAGYGEQQIEEWEKIPVLIKPYTQLWNDIKEKKRLHNQADFGPSFVPEENVCGTAMCTAGHLVNMAGAIGYELKNKYGWADAAALIHLKSCPDLPLQNFGGIQQSWALAYLEEMAELESKKD